MKSRLFIKLASLFLVIKGAVCYGTVNLPDKALEHYIERVLENSRAPGLVVGIVSDGKLSWAKGFGYRDLETKKPMTTQTVFTIGSISKSFTATLAGILVDQGKLDWATPIQSYLPEFKMAQASNAKKVNLVHLLSHQTGMPRHDFIWLTDRGFKRKDVLN